LKVKIPQIMADWFRWSNWNSC